MKKLILGLMVVVGVTALSGCGEDDNNRYNYQNGLVNGRFQMVGNGQCQDIQTGQFVAAQNCGYSNGFYNNGFNTGFYNNGFNSGFNNYCQGQFRLATGQYISCFNGSCAGLTVYDLYSGYPRYCTY